MHKFSAIVTSLDAILAWREEYRREMDCQIIHDSFHTRPGWSIEYLLAVGDERAGYGSLVVSGPWEEKPTVYEFYLLPQYRLHAFDLFAQLLASSQAVSIEIQSNDPLITAMLHTFAHQVTCEMILFHDKITTTLPPEGARFRPVASDDVPRLLPHQKEATFLLDVDNEIVASGGILFHYNRPYGDIFMEVAEPFRRRGLGAFMVQELKRVCYEQGSVPAARCNAANIASRHTLQKAGFVPCGNILSGSTSHSS